MTGFFISYSTFVCTIAAKWCTKTQTNYISMASLFHGLCFSTSLEPEKCTGKILKLTGQELKFEKNTQNRPKIYFLGFFESLNTLKHI